jgi:wyosine [tRNA(Phe)-imidazoG37] synthetase (radical SAM superfamily)
LDKVKEELRDFFKNNPDPEYITFSGAGEPTLNSMIGNVLEFIKELRPHIPVALLTNATLFQLPEVRKEVLAADLVLPSLDAGTQEAFEKINRPEENLRVEDHINGLMHFREEFKGKIWLEVLIIPGYNDDRENLEALHKALLKIKPDRIQLNTLDRPGTLEGLRPASRGELNNIRQLWNLPQTEIISAPANRKKIHAYREDTETAVMETLQRRPCTADDLADILGLPLNEVNKYLDVLEAEKKVKIRREQRGLFYSARQS